MGLSTTTSGLSIGRGLSLGGGLSRGAGLTFGSPASLVYDYAAAVVVNGGTVSAARQAIISTFIAAEIASGAWGLTDDYWPLWAEDASGALTSLKQLRLSTLPVAPTFAANQGYTGNGTSQYINTNFIPSMHGVNLTAGNSRLFIYERTNVATNTTGIGTVGGTTMSIRSRGSTGGIGNIAMQSNAVSFTLSVASSLGSISCSRTSNSSTITPYQRGIALTPVAVTPANTLPTSSITILARNNVSGPDQFRGSQVGFACVGAPLSATQELAQYSAVQAWATSIGANV